MPTMNGAARNGSSTSAARNANPLHSVAKHIEDMGVFAEMQFRQGKSLANRGEFQQAIAYLQRASDLANHQNADYLVELAQTFEQLDELDKAYQTYGRALTLKPPQLVALHYQRGIVAARQGKHELAVTDFAAVINSYAGAPPPDGAVRKLLANAFYRRGLVHQQWAKMPLAIQDLEQAITLDPQFADALFALGQLRFQAREFAPAEQAFQRALDAVTDFNDATSQRRLYTFHYALALLELGDQTASIASFTTVLEPVPGSFQQQHDRLMIDALFHRGRAHLSRQAHLAAIEDFSQVLAVDGHHIDAFRLRSDAFAAIGQHEQSESDVKNVLNREPDFAESFFLRALSRIGSAPKDAIADLNEAIRLRNGKTFRKRSITAACCDSKLPRRLTTPSLILKMRSVRSRSTILPATNWAEAMNWPAIFGKPSCTIPNYSMARGFIRLSTKRGPVAIARSVIVTWQLEIYVRPKSCRPAHVKASRTELAIVSSAGQSR